MQDPNDSQAADACPKAHAPVPSIQPEHRRALNSQLSPSGSACACLFAPRQAKAPALRPKVITTKLPRSNQGRAPRGGVHVPLHPHSKAAEALRSKVSKHARNRPMYKGSWMRARKPEALDVRDAQ